jgi:cytochrome oxidase Cu insertion factor (SCO1/SenC/PrrC family)
MRWRPACRLPFLPLRRSKMHAMKNWFVAACAIVLVGISQAWAGPPAGAEEQPESGIVPRYLLMDNRGRAITDQDFPGSFQLISFGYTFCPDVCPTTLAEMALIMDKLGKQARRLQPLFVTLDPERDTPEVLQRYTAYFHPRIIGLSGSPELLRSVANHFKVRYEKHWEPGAARDKYSVDHSAGICLCHTTSRSGRAHTGPDAGATLTA